jgi:ABC-type uncharacterized transport system permease subunit
MRWWSTFTTSPETKNIISTNISFSKEASQAVFLNRHHGKEQVFIITGKGVIITGEASVIVGTVIIMGGQIHHSPDSCAK